MIKSAIPVNMLSRIPWKALGYTAGGIGAAGAGAALGYKVTPHMAGYNDVENAKRMSAFLDSLGAVTIYLAALSKGRGQGLLAGTKQLGKLLGRKPKLIAGTAGTIGVSELIPAGLAASHRLSKAPVSMAESMAITSKKPSIPEAIGSALNTPVAKGLAGGAAAAGLLGLNTGLLRRKSEEEEREHVTRPRMIASDVLKYIVPALVAGGTVGSLVKRTPSPQG